MKKSKPQMTMKLRTRTKTPATQETKKAKKQTEALHKPPMSFQTPPALSGSPKVNSSGVRERPSNLRLRACSFDSTASSMDDNSGLVTPKNRLTFDDSAFKTPPIMSPSIFDDNKKHSPRSEKIRARLISTFRPTHSRKRESKRASASALGLHLEALQLNSKIATPKRCGVVKKKLANFDK